MSYIHTFYKFFPATLLMLSEFAMAEAAMNIKNSNRTLMENEKIRVREVKVYPEDKNPGIHKHESPYIAVIIKGGRINVKNINGKKEIKNFKEGEAIYVPKAVEHEVVNIGSNPIQIIEIDIK
jgi:mannose-6-phosphate isomerase-like protein (cupin superfamily)